eukprot:TRINITY_DN3348_c0_g1_i1.p1 TRINITY_DN3348_c0_g1~~TRINITY_DN3348_c0_g1_i1.p1  ORF type:complete len:625 (+),score=125.34 TRINITY_DN3348_c0_g1_i1:98-1876(+)
MGIQFMEKLRASESTAPLGHSEPLKPGDVKNLPFFGQLMSRLANEPIAKENLKSIEAELKYLSDSFYEVRPIASPTLCHESIPTGHTMFQSFLLSELIPADKVKYWSKNFEIKLQHEEKLKQLREYLNNEETLKKLEEELKAFLKTHKKEFMIYYYSMVLLFTKATTTGEDSIKHLVVGKEGPLIILILEFLLKDVIQVKAEKIKKAICEQKMAQPNTKAELVSFFEKFGSAWENFFLSSLELSQYFGVITDIMNKVAKDDGEADKDKRPQMSIWRLGVGLFHREVYGEWRKDLEGKFTELLKIVRTEQMQNKIACIKKEKEKKSTEEVKGKQNVRRWEDLRTIRKLGGFLNYMIDSNLNEVLVHHLDSTQLTEKLLLAQDTDKNWYDASMEQVFEGQFKKAGITLEEGMVVVKNDLDLLENIFLAPYHNHLRGEGYAYVNKLWCQIIREKLGKKPIIIKEERLSKILNGQIDLAEAAEKRLEDMYKICCADWKKQEEAEVGNPTICDKELEFRCEKFGVPKALSNGDSILGFYNISGDEAIFGKYMALQSSILKQWRPLRKTAKHQLSTSVDNSTLDKWPLTPPFTYSYRG